MLISTEVEVKLSGANINYYENLGYEIPRRRRSNRVSKNNLTVPIGTFIKVDIKDIPKGSHVSVDVKCDYCGRVFQKQYYKYINQMESSIVKKDCCTDCKQLKTKEGLLEKYGVERNTQIQSVKDSMSQDRRLDVDIVRNAFEKNRLNIIEETFDYKNDRSEIEFICRDHPNEGIQTTSYMILRQGGSGCKKCRYDKISNENCHMWKGGTTPLHTYLRGKIRDWKSNSMIECNYKCVLTGFKFDVIHHLYGFNEIVNELINNLNLEIKEDISKYSNSELEEVVKECNRLHDKYGLGVCLVEDLHKLYHSTNMGNPDTAETFNNFKNRYLNGEFDNLLEEKFKSINININ